MRRLEAAGVNVAIWDDGQMQIVVSESDTVQAIDSRGTIYSPADMYTLCTCPSVSAGCCINLSEPSEERRNGERSYERTNATKPQGRAARARESSHHRYV